MPRTPTPVCRFGFSAACVCLALFVAHVRAAGNEAVALRESPLAAAQEQARRESRGVLLAFVAGWSAGSREFEEKTLRDARVARLLGERTVMLKFDLMDARADAARFHVKNVPTLILLSPDGVELERWIDAPAPQDFARDIGAALRGEPSLARERARLKPDDMRGRLEIDRRLVEQGRYDAALEELLWILDADFGEANSTPEHYGRDRGRVGGRMKSVPYARVVAVVAAMRAAHEPAQAELQARFERARQAVLAEPENALAADSFRALASVLGERGAVLTVFRALPAGKARSDLRSSAFLELVRERAYAEAAPLCEIELIIQRIEHPPEVPAAIRGIITAMMPTRAPLGFRAMRHFEVLRNAVYFEAFAGADSIADARRTAEAMLRGNAPDEKLEADVRRHRGVTEAGLGGEPVGGVPGVLIRSLRRARPDGYADFLAKLGVPALNAAYAERTALEVNDASADGSASVLPAHAADLSAAPEQNESGGPDDVVNLDAFLVEAACPGVLPFFWFHASGMRTLSVRPAPPAVVAQQPEFSAFDPSHWGGKPFEGIVAINGREIVRMSAREIFDLWRIGDAGDEVHLIVQGVGTEESHFREVTVRRVAWVKHEQVGREGIVVDPDPNRRKPETPPVPPTPSVKESAP